METGEHDRTGNYSIRCDCGQYLLRYSRLRHEKTIGHMNYLATL